MSKNTWAVLVAAGKGARAGLGGNKVLYPINGRCALLRALDALFKSTLFAGVVVVLSKEDFTRFFAFMGNEPMPPCALQTAVGGNTRQESVYNGLLALPKDTETVLIHDAARPFVSREILEKSVLLARENGSGVVALPVFDTVFENTPGKGFQPIDRARLRAVQTPQSFRYAEIFSAHVSARDDGYTATDDAGLYAKYCASVCLFEDPSAQRNQKLTTKEDFMRQTASAGFRVGTGYDVHRLVAGRRLFLCGIEIPHETGLDGVSDADVALHALMDAILGAMAMGDIGRYFPDTDETYRGISSVILLEKVMEMARINGYRVQNADITIVAQRPKLAGYMEDMQKSVANALGVAPSQVNVKATTTEHLGFEGEERGISAQAAVLLTKGADCAHF